MAGGSHCSRIIDLRSYRYWKKCPRLLETMESTLTLSSKAVACVFQHEIRYQYFTIFRQYVAISTENRNDIIGHNWTGFTTPRRNAKSVNKLTLFMTRRRTLACSRKLFHIVVFGKKSRHLTAKAPPLRLRSSPFTPTGIISGREKNYAKKKEINDPFIFYREICRRYSNLSTPSPTLRFSIRGEVERDRNVLIEFEVEAQ